MRLLWSLLLCGAAFAAEPALTRPSYNLFTDQDEEKLGDVLAPIFEARYPVLDNPLLNAYIAGVTKRLGDRSRRPGLSYSVKILNISAVDCFSLPGGRIYLTRGAVDLARTESEFAAAVAHEMGHIAGRHALNRFSLELRSKSLWESARSALPNLAGDNVEQAFQSLGAPVAQMLSYPYDHANESEADLLAFYNLIRAGWNPAGQVRWLGRIEGSGSDPDLLAAFRSSRPDLTGRSRAISAEIKVVSLPRSLSDDSLAFPAMKFGLDMLPKPSPVR